MHKIKEMLHKDENNNSNNNYDAATARQPATLANNYGVERTRDGKLYEVTSVNDPAVLAEQQQLASSGGSAFSTTTGNNYSTSTSTTTTSAPITTEYITTTTTTSDSGKLHHGDKIGKLESDHHHGGKTKYEEHHHSSGGHHGKTKYDHSSGGHHGDKYYSSSSSSSSYVEGGAIPTNIGHTKIEKDKVAKDVIKEAKVVDEKIKEVELHKVKPVIHRDREQVEIRHVIKPEERYNVKDTKLRLKEKDIDLGVREAESSLATSRSLGHAPEVESSRTFLGKEKQHQELGARVEEHVHKKVEEHIHPVIYKETLKPKVIEETQHVYERVHERPIETYEVKNVVHHDRGTLINEREFFETASREAMHSDYANTNLHVRRIETDQSGHHHQGHIKDQSLKKEKLHSSKEGKIKSGEKIKSGDKIKSDKLSDKHKDKALYKDSKLSSKKEESYSKTHQVV